MSERVTEAGLAVAVLERELTTLRAERDDYRGRWLRQVDINDKLRARLAADSAAMDRLEAMGRE